MSQQTTGLKRNDTDKYYTAPHIVEFCVNKFQETVTNLTEAVIIEPSAGNGAFIPAIKTLTNKHLFYDIKPDNDADDKEIVTQDFTKLNVKEVVSCAFPTVSKICFLGNPPFGRQAKFAKLFIKHACKTADYIAFILPKSFKKDSNKKSFNPYFHLLVNEELPENSFMVNNSPYDVPCVFQVWEKRDYKREIPPTLKPTGYKFVKQNESPHLAFRRVGIYAGEFYTNYENKSHQSHYFIKFDDDKQLTEAFLNKLKNIKFESRDDTVGPRSISKQELIKELIMVL